ncbi:MAG: hypothetical protein ABIP14_03185 [Blastocatellia bacterium]
MVKTHPAWSVDEVEEALDHADGAGKATQLRAQSSSRENARLDWQKEFLDYLIAEGKNAEASRLAEALEQEFKGRFARPAWLRLAKLRLELRAGLEEVGIQRSYAAGRLREEVTMILK